MVAPVPDQPTIGNPVGVRHEREAGRSERIRGRRHGGAQDISTVMTQEQHGAAQRGDDARVPGGMPDFDGRGTAGWIGIAHTAIVNGLDEKSSRLCEGKTNDLHRPMLPYRTVCFGWRERGRRLVSKLPAIRYRRKDISVRYNRRCRGVILHGRAPIASRRRRARRRWRSRRY